MLFNRKQRRESAAVISPPAASSEVRPAPPQTSPPAKRIASTSVAGPSHSVIDAWLVITGDLKSEGDVLVNGQIHGNICCKTLIVGADATINGGILADEVVIRGKVKGVIRALSVRVERSAHVESDLYHSQLAIEEGAVFEGASRNRKDPKSIDIDLKPQVVELRAKGAELKLQERPEGAVQDTESKEIIPPDPSARAPLARMRKNSARESSVS